MIEVLCPKQHPNLAQLIEECSTIRQIGSHADSSTIGQLTAHKNGLEEGDWLCEAHIIQHGASGHPDAYLRLADINHISSLSKDSRWANYGDQNKSHKATLEIERLCINTDQPHRDPVDHWYLCVRELMTECLRYGLNNGYCLLAGYAEIPGLERLTKLGLPIVTHGRPIVDGSKWLYRFHIECNQQNLAAISHVKVVREAPTKVKITSACSTDSLLKELADIVASASPKKTLSSKLKTALRVFSGGIETQNEKQSPQRRWIGD